MENENKKINYSKYEELLKDTDIWKRSGDFGYQYREDQKEFAKNKRKF